MGELLIVRSKVRDLAKKKKMNLGGDAADALSKEVAKLVDRAAERAKANRRSTIKGRDI
jgi:histone H3/H4